MRDRALSTKEVKQPGGPSWAERSYDRKEATGVLLKAGRSQLSAAVVGGTDLRLRPWKYWRLAWGQTGWFLLLSPWRGCLL